MRRNPPDILITTPESLYLMLTSQAREILTDVEAVIVDEIHAVAGTKRGAHLALTLERLAALQEHGTDPQRIGLCATQNPLEEVGASWSARSATAKIVDAGVRKDARPEDPGAGRVDGRARADAPVDPLDPLAGGEATRKSIWPAIYPQILELVQEHRSTIVFVNNRRGAERLAIRLNELAEEDIARAHHGSLAREERTVIEEMLKAGELPCLVATSSLELGIDMGAVDLVLQVESPKSVARGLQRIGRAGHGVGATSQGPDLPEVPRRPARVRGRHAAHARGRDRADGRAAQRARRARPADRRDRGVAAGRRAGRRRRRLRARHPHVLLRRAAARAARERARHARRALPVARVRRAAPAHRVGPRRRHDPRAQGLARARDHERRHDPRPRPVHGHAARRAQGRRARRGDGLRGAARARRSCSARRRGGSRTSAATASRSRPRRARRARCRSGRATASAGRRSSARRSARSAAGRSSRTPRCSRATTTSTRSPPRTCSTSCASSRRPRASCRRTARSSSSASATRSATGGCASSRPFGGRIHSAWALALSARIRDEYGLESDAIWSDDGIIVHLPDADEPPGAELVLIDPDELEDLVVGELGGSALFGARFRENAARSLLIPRAYPGKRTPLWQQRLKAQSLLEVAKRYGDFPVILETYRECLRDVLDLPGPARAAARAAPPRAVARRGRDADRLAVRVVAAVRLRRDVHVRGRHAERRAARGGAVARPRPAARAARPGGAARPHRPGRAASRSRTTCSTAPSARAPRRATRCTTCCAASAT